MERVITKNEGREGIGMVSVVTGRLDTTFQVR